MTKTLFSHKEQKSEEQEIRLGGGNPFLPSHLIIGVSLRRVYFIGRYK